MPKPHVRGDNAVEKIDSDKGEADVEGHNMMIDPSASRIFANQRNKDVERAAKARQREKEARGR